MIMPSNCPDCNKPLQESAIIINQAEYARERTCKIHNVMYRSLPANPNEVDLIYYDLSYGVRALWYMTINKFIFNTLSYDEHNQAIDAIDYTLPWFVPNFADHDAMISKLKLYLTFL